MFEEEKIAKEFGAFIREARERKGIYQEDIAKQLGKSRSYYSMIESGQRKIYFSLAVNICAVLGVDISEFMKRIA